MANNIPESSPTPEAGTTQSYALERARLIREAKDHPLYSGLAPGRRRVHAT